MKINIRQEKPSDFKEVFDLVKNAFISEEYKDPEEQLLVERLRKSNAFIPELSLVAEVGNKIVGHILLTKLKIKNGTDEFGSLALAPVSVLPEYQANGIGGQLIENAHKKAIALGYESVVLLGHENYYPKFGYKQADTFRIELPFDVPKANCMAIELTENGLKDISGMVEYPKEFGE